MDNVYRGTRRSVVHYSTTYSVLFPLHLGSILQVDTSRPLSLMILVWTNLHLVANSDFLKPTPSIFISWYSSRRMGHHFYSFVNLPVCFQRGPVDSYSFSRLKYLSDREHSDATFVPDWTLGTSWRWFLCSFVMFLSFFEHVFSLNEVDMCLVIMKSFMIYC